MNEVRHTLSFPTDTACPVTIVPIFYMHNGPQRFCLNPDCACHSNEDALRAILEQLLDGTLCLRKTDGERVRRGIPHGTA